MFEGLWDMLDLCLGVLGDMFGKHLKDSWGAMFGTSLRGV